MKPKSILNVACILIVFCLLAVPAYPWSSVNGGNHLDIDKSAYKMLTRTRDFNPRNFPDIGSISSYTGMGYTGKWGPDAYDFEKYPNKGNPYETYRWSNHYYNPSANRGAGEGNAHYRAQYWYRALVNEIKNGRAKSQKAARAAAYLAHYVADVGCPYHIQEKMILNPSPKHIDWYDPYYKEIRGVPTGYHPSWEALAHRLYSRAEYPSMSSKWQSGRSGSSQIISFVKKIAERTRKNRDRWWGMNSDKREPLQHSVRDVFTVYKAAYDEGTSR